MKTKRQVLALSLPALLMFSACQVPLEEQPGITPIAPAVTAPPAVVVSAKPDVPITPASLPSTAIPTPTATPVASAGSLTNSLGMTFVRIAPTEQPGSPNGWFQMGSPASEMYRTGDEDLHSVRLRQVYYLQTTEVTQSQWQAVMGSNPSTFQVVCVLIDAICVKNGAMMGSNPNAFNEANLPVENVDWDEVQQFIQRLNQRGEGTYRLPTEAEWEYAARAGTSTPFGIGNGLDLDSTQANFNGKYPKPVKSFAPNAWGLYDMHGNVWEWIQDWYGPYQTRWVEVDPQGPPVGKSRVFRGGGWRSTAPLCRSAYRGSIVPGYRGSDLGFRLLRSL